mmetsp:Transcript_29607/g.36734  ORF Transcript_29607/g.36734 Transcript_29607/m.36734 type:complete len:138 (+) Transcript_29607:384-797(+)
MTAIFNMLFLLSKRIAKLMRGEVMDEELFRTYFIRLFRGIRQMEQKFADVMDPEEDDCFVRYSKAMCDLADIFKIAKQEKPREDRDVTELTKKKTFKKNQIEVSKMIFGLGACPKESRNETCFFRIMPTKILGFSKI